MMRKALYLLLALALLLPLASCSSGLAPQETVPTLTATEEKKPQQTEEEADTLKEDYGPYDYPDGFSAGFSKVCISPEAGDYPVMTTGSISPAYGHSLKSDLYVTCVAVCDGKNVALFYSFDTKFIKESFEQQGKKMLAEKFGIPAENAVFNASHSHTSPDGEGPSVARHLRRSLQAIVTCADEALRDLAQAEIYTGRGDTTGFAFVRRYLMSDGTYMGIHSANPLASEQPVSHESQADPELRTVRFDRGDKKDIVMVNWQCHAASDAGYKIKGKGVISADFVGKLREVTESEMDVHCAYFNGASGNINMHSKIKEEEKFASTDDLGIALAQVVKEAVNSDTPVQSGSVQAKMIPVTCTVRKDEKERRAAHAAADAAAPVKQKYYHTGIQSKYDEMCLKVRSSLPKTQELSLYVISFGDVAYAGAPFEMCDGSGMELRSASPFQTTFSCGYTGGACGYVPTDDMFPHGEYEVYSCRYVSGTAELCVGELVKALNELKSAS